MCCSHQIVSAGTFKHALDYKGQKAGSISIQAQEQGGMQRTLKLSLRGVKLDKKDFFGKMFFCNQALKFIYLLTMFICRFILIFTAHFNHKNTILSFLTDGKIKYESCADNKF